MTVFVAHLLDGAELLAEKLESAYPSPNHYKLADNLYLVQSADIAEGVANQIGLDGDNPELAGEVYKLNGSFAGFTRRAIWDWLDLAYERSKS